MPAVPVHEQGQIFTLITIQYLTRIRDGLPAHTKFQRCTFGGPGGQSNAASRAGGLDASTFAMAGRVAWSRRRSSRSPAVVRSARAAQVRTGIQSILAPCHRGAMIGIRAPSGDRSPRPVSMMQRRMAMPRPESAELGVIFDLAAIAQEMRGEEAYAREGHTARTLVREPDLRVVLIVMRAGSRIPEHTVNGTASIQTLAGFLRLHLPRLPRQREDRIVDLPIGRLLVLEPGDEHGVEAAADSVVLVTFGWTGKARPT